MQDFRELIVWQKAHHLVLNIYKVTGSFPDPEKFGLVSQMRRSAASIPTNIAEGCVKSSDADFARFLSISLGSASELEYQLLLAHDLAYIASDEYQRLNHNVNEVKRILIAFIRKLKS